MSVNTMTFEEASAILNNIREQVTGETSIAPVNTSEFVSVGTSLVQSKPEPVLGAIMQMVTKTIFSVRPYTRKFGGIKVDSQMWGSIVRKLAVVDKPFTDNKEFDLVDGQSIDHYIVNKPEVLELKYYGATKFAKYYTVFKDQLNSAFDSVNQFNSFLAMVVQNTSDMIEQNFESIARMTIANFVGGKNVANNGVVHLLTEYNTETGANPPLTTTTVYAPENFGNFMKWVYARIATLTSLMTERSTEFQINVSGKEITRHTPFEDQKVYLYAKLLNDMNARVLADTYNYDFIRYADVEAVNYWQSIDNPMEIDVTPNYLDTDGSIKTGTEQHITNLVGVIFDREALGYTVMNEWSATTPLNASGGYWNTFFHFLIRWWVSYDEKGIVLLLD